jgi:hypothetical protein
MERDPSVAFAALRLPQDDTRRTLRLAALCTIIIALAGGLAVFIIPRGFLSYRSLFYEQFARLESPHLFLMALFATAALLLARGPEMAPVESLDQPSTRTVGRAYWLAVAFATLVIIVGFRAAFDGYFLADDEYSAWFQTLIFAHGRAAAVVTPAWCRFLPALTPTTIVESSPCTLTLGFPPLHSLYRSAFVVLHADFLAGPVTLALTIAFVAATARRLWPGKPHRTLVTILVLATSTQMLFTSMTMYSMPTHLLMSAMWLWLFVVGTPWAIVLLPVVGFVAFGVHSPIPHGLWVIPFILRFAWRRQWLAFVYLAVGYAVNAAFWTHRLGFGGVTGSALASASATTSAVRSLFGIPDTIDQLTTAMHIALVGTWNSPIVLLCLMVALLSWRRLDTMSRDLVLSIGLIVLARAFQRTAQGEGWGYRYVYDALTNIALLTAVGLDFIAEAIGKRRATLLATTSVAASVLLQIPLRMVGVRSIVAPYARTYDWMSHLPAQVVVFNGDDVMWARQMLRNDPFLRARPVLMEVHGLSKRGGLTALQAAFPAGQVRVVTKDELRQFGAPPAPLRFGGITSPP